MEHLEAVERIAAAVVGPDKLSRIEADRSPAGIELRRHLEACSECRAELRAWRLVDLALAEATPDDLRAPAEARGRILDTVVTSGVLRGPAAGMPSTVAPVQADAPAATGIGRQTPRLTALGDTASKRDRPVSVAVPGVETSDASQAVGTVSTTPTGFTIRRSLLAAAVVVLFVTGALLGGPLGLAPVHDDASAELTKALAYAADVLGQPEHVVASLQTPAGAPGGAVALAPGSGDLVVVSGALAPPSGGQRYVCYFERDGERTAVGSMWFVGTSAYWTGESRTPVTRAAGATGSSSSSRVRRLPPDGALRVRASPDRRGARHLDLGGSGATDRVAGSGWRKPRCRRIRPSQPQYSRAGCRCEHAC